MLTIVPSNLDDYTAGERRTMSRLQNLYKEVPYEAFLFVRPRVRDLEPDFVLLDPKKGVAVIEVKDWSLDYIKKATPTEVLVEGGKTLPNPAHKTNRYFNLTKSLLAMEMGLVNPKDGELVFNFYAHIVFPNLSDEEVDSEGLRVVLERYPSGLMTSDVLKRAEVDTFFGDKASPLSIEQINLVRKVLFPEIIVTNNQHSNLFDFEDKREVKTLDLKQEQLAKRIPYGHYMLSGVPGSGKTVVLLSRALFLIKKHPKWRVVIVTYTNALVDSLKRRLDSIKEDLDFNGINHGNIEIITFHKLAMRTAGLVVPRYLKNNEEKNNWFANILPEEALKVAVREYDALLVDEYQDFYDSWIKVCLAVCKKFGSDSSGEKRENLFLVGDKMQSIYNKNIDTSWRDLGVFIQGRSDTLKLSYRSGRSHIRLALDFLLTNNSLAKLVDRFYDSRNGIQALTGVEDKVSFIEGGFGKVTALMQELIYNKGYQPEDILILVPKSIVKEEFVGQLPDSLAVLCSSEKDWQLGKINISTIHSAKGLEAKVCILLGLDSESSGQSETEKMLLLYVGMTRAAKELYLHAVSFAGNTLSARLKRVYQKESEAKKLEKVVVFG